MPGFTACVRLSPDGSLLAVTSESRCGVDIWDHNENGRFGSAGYHVPFGRDQP
jgi:hypothetical protein